MAQLDSAFALVAEGSEPTEGFHFSVNSMVQKRPISGSTATFADPQRERRAEALLLSTNLMSLVPIVGGAGIHLQRHIERDRRMRRAFHHILHQCDGIGDFLLRHLEHQFVVHL